MIGNGIFVSALFVFVVGILAWRLLFNQLTGSLNWQERILVVGTGDSARKVVREILDQREFAYRVIGFIDDDPARIGERIVNPGIVGTPADMAGLIDRHQIDRIVGRRIGATSGQDPGQMAGIRVEDADDDLRVWQDSHRRSAPSWLIFPTASASRESRDGSDGRLI